MANLQGKVVVITGAARGVGRALAQAFAAAGADVAIGDLREADAVATAKEIAAKTGRRVIAVGADVTRIEDVRKLRDAAIAQLGKIDVLVNNAGWDKLRTFLKTTPELWDKVIGINYRGVLNTTYEILPHMVERKQGCIVNISSDSARVGSMGEAVYAGAKAAVIAFSKTIAREHARDNVRVNVICPGLIDTPLLDEIKGEEFGGKVIGAVVNAIPLKRLGRPEEIAPLAVFLASDEAGYITGQVTSVNGGLTMAG
ncbi:MAG: glucose 1-dehydrogenase [Acidobacteriia bacterium]|nr:glucose 1-dehydrogenase [Terriglobia bacterium]